ncbi:MAG: hypothetical protein M9938_08420 [Solirubrobacterales bacterium]|nr:hypothetical protein [Solirubrobacterales bacterium]
MRLGILFLALLSFGAILAPTVSAKTGKARVTVAYGVYGHTIKANGSVRQPGLRKKGRTANRVLLEERVKRGQRVRWVVRARSRPTRKPGRSNRFRLKWKTPPRQVWAVVRVRVLRGKRQVARARTRTFRFRVPVRAPKVAAPDPAEILQAPSPDQEGELRLSGERFLSPGEVLATGVGPATPNGFLGRVVSSRIENGTTIVQTRPASLMEAAPNASFDVSGNDLQPAGGLSPDELRFARAVTGGPAITPAALNRLIRPAEVPKPVDTGKKTGTCGPSDGFKAENSLKGSIGTRFAMSWNKFLGMPTSVKSARAEATFTLTQELKISSAVGVTCSAEISLLPDKIRFQPITFAVGPVPVVLVPEVDFKLKLSGAIEAKVSFSVRNELGLTGGIKYENGRASPISRVTRSFDATAEASAGAEASATVGPKLGMKLYGVVGPSVSLLAGVTGSAVPYRDPWLRIDGLVETAAAIEFQVWKIDFSKSVRGPSVTWPILRIDEDPNPPVDPDPPGMRAKLSWAADADVDLHIWDQDGDHVYYSNQEGIYESFLDYDVIPGEGEYGGHIERFYETADFGRPYLYGVCLYSLGESPQADVTLEVFDPGGGTRTFPVRLDGDNYEQILAVSPTGASVYDPTWDGWCAGPGDHDDSGDDEDW